MTDKETARSTIERAKEDLRRIKDELEVKASLAKLEAQKAAERLEPHVKKLEHALDDALGTVGSKVGDAAEKARLQATLAAGQAKADWPGFEAAVDHVLTDVKNELKKTADAIDPDKTAAEVQEKLSALKKRLFG